MLKHLLCALLAVCIAFAAVPFSINSTFAEENNILTLPAGLTEIGEEAFMNVPAEHIIVPEGVETIGSGAFSGCKNLRYIEIPDSVVHIAPDAFDGCENLCILCMPGSTAAFCAEIAGIPWRDIAGEETVYVSEIKLDAASLSLNVGGSRRLNAQVLPENAADTSLLWASSDESVAAVSEGLIRALAPGMAVITAASADGGAEAFCTVTVQADEGAITFSGMAADASSTNAYLYVKADAAKSGSFTTMGLRVWDAKGKLAADYEKTISTTSKTSTTMWFDVFSDSGVQLAPDTEYTCQMHISYNSKTYWTDFVKVTTDASVEIDASLSVEEMVANLENCKDTSVLSSSKKTAMVTMADALLGEGYHPAFVAGVLANIYYEGTFGKFESSKYSNGGAPVYLVYMDNNYDYRSKYSGKLIYNGISLSELSDMLDELAAANWKGKFGLGSVQWTGGRTKNLVKIYIEEADGSDTITQEQVIAAEVKMIKSELAGAYKSIYSKWSAAYADQLYSDDAACGSGYRVCVSYEVPATYRSKAITRGQKAEDVYKIMMGL